MRVKGDFNTFTSVTNILNELGWQRLEDRRRDLRLALMYKIVHGLVAVPVDSLNLEPKDKRTRANHGYTYKHLSPKTDPVKFFFTNRTIPAWNALSASAVEAPSVESFEAKLAACCRPSPEGLERAPAPQPIRLYTLRRGLRIIHPDHEMHDCLIFVRFRCFGPIQVQTDCFEHMICTRAIRCDRTKIEKHETQNEKLNSHDHVPMGTKNK